MREAAAVVVALMMMMRVVVETAVLGQKKAVQVALRTVNWKLVVMSLLIAAVKEWVNWVD